MFVSLNSFNMESGFINVFLVCLACYLIGSFPTAFIIVKLKHNIDLTKEGSGNIGTLNSIQVSSSKITGIIVLFIDILKGFLPLYFLLFIFHIDYRIVMAGSSFLILGHNYPVWLGFKGGRGLATGTGIFILLNYFVLTGWCIAWAVVFGIKRNVLIANAAATMSIPVYILIINMAGWLVVDLGISSFSIFYFSLFSVIITIIIITKHLEIFRKKIN